MSSVMTISSNPTRSPTTATTPPFFTPTEWHAQATLTDRSLPSSTVSSNPSQDPYETLRKYDLDPATDADSSLTIPNPITPHSQQPCSAIKRRHLSKLSFRSLTPLPRESDADSVLSEPCSYSASSYVASDMWLVHRDVAAAERFVAQRERERERHRPRAPLSRRADDVFSGRAEQFERSSKLVRLFFSGDTAMPPMPTPPGRAGSKGVPAGMGRDRDDGEGGRRFLFGGGFGFGVDGDGMEKKVPLQKNRQGMYEEAFVNDFSGYHRKRRFHSARKIRWWLRRVSHRVRGEAEGDF